MDTDGTGDLTNRYAERLYPSPGVLLAAATFAAGCAAATLPLGTPAAVVTFGLVAVVVAVLFARGAAPVEVRDGRFVAGRARLPLDVVGEVEPLDAAEMRHARGPGLDARAYLCLRGWVRGGVRVHLRDPADPAPYWLVSSRRPAALAAALSAAATSARER